MIVHDENNTIKLIFLSLPTLLCLVQLPIPAELGGFNGYLPTPSNIHCKYPLGMLGISSLSITSTSISLLFFGFPHIHPVD